MAVAEQPSVARDPFEAFLETARPRLRRLLAHFRIPVEDAEDLLQEILLALVFRWDQVRDPESWLLGTAKRHCLMYWRRMRRRLYTAVDSELLERLAPSAAPVQDRDDLLNDLDSLIDELPPRCRKLLHLRFRMGLDPIEVARELGYQESSIAKTTNRCLERLSKKLAAKHAAPRRSPKA
jgi:RNA polymerase sigma factor (sigma-70 family)